MKLAPALCAIPFFALSCGTGPNLSAPAVSRDPVPPEYAVVAAMPTVGALPVADFRSVGYVPTWVDLSALARSIDWNDYTHFNLAFYNPDSAAHFTLDPASRDFLRAARLRGTPVFASLGGGSASYEAAGRAVWARLLQPDSRPALVASIVAFARAEGFAGVDVDLEGPAIGADYPAFIRELAAALRPAGLGLTAALAAEPDSPYLTAETLAAFDWINVMAYDAAGPWDPTAGGQHSSFAGAVASLDAWVARGVDAQRLTLGIPFYGYGFGALYRDYGYDWAEIVARWPAAAAGDCLDFGGSSRLWYNGPQLVAAKTRLALARAGGVMFWQVGADAPSPLSLAAVASATVAAADPTDGAHKP